MLKTILRNEKLYLQFVSLSVYTNYSKYNLTAAFADINFRFAISRTKRIKNKNKVNMSTTLRCT